MQRTLIIAPLLVLTWLLTEDFTVAGFGFSLLLAVLISLALPKLPKQSLTLGNVLSSCVALMKHLGGVLLISLPKAGMRVAQLVLFQPQSVDPKVEKVTSGVDSDLDRAISAHAMTITPGELVVEFSPEGDLWSHLLEPDKKDAYQKAQNERAENIRKITVIFNKNQRDVE